MPRTLYLDLMGIPRSIEIRPSVHEFGERENFVLALFARLNKEYAVQTVWPHQYLCDAHFCQIQKDGRPLYIDDQHLTRSAAESLSPIFGPIFTHHAVAHGPSG